MGLARTNSLSPKLGMIVLVVAVLVAACGGGEEVVSGDAPTPEVEGTPAAVATGAATTEPTLTAEAGEQATQGNTCEGVDLSSPPDEPVAMPLGRGPSSEEPLYIMAADPEAAGAEHVGSWYDLEITEYTPPDRLAAFQAGELVGGTTSTPQLFSAVDSGVPIAAVASIANISDQGGYTYPFVALSDSGIASPEDLQGTKIGIIAPNTATEYWAKSAVASAGLDPARDAEYVAVPPPNAGQALASGQVDVMMLIRSFDGPVRNENDVVDVFDALTGPGFDHEFLVVFLGTEFIEENLGAACAFITDYQTSMDNWIADREPAAEVLVEQELVGAPSVEIFLSAPDDGRTENAAIDLENLQNLLDSMVEVGFYEEALGITAEDLVVDGVSVIQ